MNKIRQGKKILLGIGLNPWKVNSNTRQSIRMETDSVIETKLMRLSFKKSGLVSRTERTLPCCCNTTRHDTTGHVIQERNSCLSNYIDRRVKWLILRFPS
jgi:hypothetical protein